MVGTQLFRNNDWWSFNCREHTASVRSHDSPICLLVFELEFFFKKILRAITITRTENTHSLGWAESIVFSCLMSLVYLNLKCIV